MIIWLELAPTFNSQDVICVVGKVCEVVIPYRVNEKRATIRSRNAEEHGRVVIFQNRTGLKDLNETEEGGGYFTRRRSNVLA